VIPAGFSFLQRFPEIGGLEMPKTSPLLNIRKGGAFLEETWDSEIANALAPKHGGMAWPS